MYQFKRILTCLDFSDIDESVIRYTNYLASVVGAEKIYFMHTAPSLELPDEVKEKYPELLAPLDESLAAQIKSKLSASLSKNVLAMSVIEVQEGKALDAILKWSKIKEIDLIVMGKKHIAKGTGTLAKKVARMANCSVLFVVDQAEPKISHIEVPTDFSDHSHMAFQVAEHLSEKVGASVNLHHVYEVPIGYYKIGLSYEEFADIMKGNAIKQVEKWLSKAHFAESKIHTTYSLNKDNSATALIYGQVKTNSADLMIIGSKGRTAAASVLLGSVAEKIIATIEPCSILIVKKRGENMGLFEALFNL